MHFGVLADFTQYLWDALRASQSFTPIGNFPLYQDPFLLRDSRLFILSPGDEWRIAQVLRKC